MPCVLAVHSSGDNSGSRVYKLWLAVLRNTLTMLTSSSRRLGELANRHFVNRTACIQCRMLQIMPTYDSEQLAEMIRSWRGAW
ncbi:hypothetical protein BDR03DRAFT_976324 [Suillus americanus]|nr:hypothetical protein BDR03DRAFT_976324 [Suillus americanus]